jgi:lipoprotein-anchoring transpeptidase ErfK/SrfK
MRERLGRRLVLAVGLVVVVLGATQTASAAQCPDGWCGDTKPPPMAAPPVVVPGVPPALSITPATNATAVAPLGAVSVKATAGKLIDVQMVNDQGGPIAGVMTPDGTGWKPADSLGYGRTYTVTATARGTDSTTATAVSTFTTLTPDDETKVSLTTTGHADLVDGGTYGVGTVIVAHFDEPISNKALAESRMTVTTSPPVAGSWFWLDDQTAHWRPQHYYAPGTTVGVHAKVYGVELGDGLYGQEDTNVSFTIGDAHVSIADDNTKQVSVYDNGQLVRTMPTSMGRGGSATVDGRTISFWTPPGVYTVMDKGNPVIMDSSTFGLPLDSAMGYREAISYATRISPDGIYLHQLLSTVWAQGNTDTSHGCLNLNADNAQWFFNFSVPGDVVEVRNTGGQPLAVWQNGDWTVPWADWVKGSARV